MGEITSANAIFTLNVPGVFPSGVTIQGYAADDAFTQAAFDVAETRMGVDGILSAGYTPSPKPLDITLQPDSPSWPFFLQWKLAEEATKSKFVGAVTIDLPAIGFSFDFGTVWLKNLQGMPSAKKVLDPVPIKLEAQDLTFSPL